MTKLEANTRFILLAVLAELEEFAALPDEAFESGEPFVVAMFRHGVPFSPAFWLGGRLSPARRMAYSRAARRLADRGQIVRVTEPSRDRVRYLVPTPDGLRRALAIAGDMADRTAIREGLRRTRWGRSLAKRIEEGR